jgi:hypothetical protein
VCFVGELLTEKIRGGSVNFKPNAISPDFRTITVKLLCFNLLPAESAPEGTNSADFTAPFEFRIANTPISFFPKSDRHAQNLIFVPAAQKLSPLICFRAAGTAGKASHRLQIKFNVPINTKDFQKLRSSDRK